MFHLGPFCDPRHILARVSSTRSGGAQSNFRVSLSSARTCGAVLVPLSGYNSTVEDAEIVKHINSLVADYRHLERQHGGLGLTPEQRKGLSELQAEIDRNWAVLRQRRARRHAGGDPDIVLTGSSRAVKTALG